MTAAVDIRTASAELVVLRWYSRIRSQAGFDYGCGQRYAEINRRALELGADRLEEHQLDRASVQRALDRIARPRLRRAELELEKWHTRSTRLTVHSWQSTIKQLDRFFPASV